ncbi:MAG: lamin tail domain-containing protein [Flavisolibacter sp.]
MKVRPLKTKTPIHKAVASLCLIFFSSAALAQGRVVVNEFMPWSGCSTTNEFIELMNFGPGPMNIGCYIVTNGKYAVTIPPNTVVKAGQYFILSGQNVLSTPCANRDSAIHVDLNWNTCNCSNTAIPTTGDGFMQDGGSANEKVILLDPLLNVVDAVSRSSTPSPSISITTASLNGGCASKTFNLDQMAISYESINNSTGIDNSFARKVDGDCGWVKTPAISAHAPNKTGNTSSATYNFATVSASNCNGSSGSVSIQVQASNVNTLFPMTYILGFDKDANSLFDEQDQYKFGTDSTASTIDISNLSFGQYNMTVGSSLGCNLKTFSFYIFDCYGVALPVKLISFRYEGLHNGSQYFSCEMDGWENLKALTLETDSAGRYHSVATIGSPSLSTKMMMHVSFSMNQQYRLRMVDKNGLVSYSQVITVPPPMMTASTVDVGADNLHIHLASSYSGILNCTIFNNMGEAVERKRFESPRSESLSLPISTLRSGVYYLSLEGSCMLQPFSVPFIR